jgi:glutaminase
MRKFFIHAIFTFVLITGLYSCTSSSNANNGIDNSSITQPATTISMPKADELKAIVQEAYSKFKGVSEGKNADYIPYLAKVNSKLFGIAIVTAQGAVYTAGDVNYPFAIESVSKPFTLALALQTYGDQDIYNKIGVEPTGLPFNSELAVELLKVSTNQNPVGNGLVNAGAMATVSLIKAATPEEKFNTILKNISDFAGESLTLNQEVYISEANDNHGNKGIAERLKNFGFMYDDPVTTVDVYTKQCSINVTAKQLAVMGATLANNGVNPITKKKVLDAKYVPKLLAVMTMAGFYDESGWWAFTTGLPAKTGVGGGIVAIVPGKYAIVGFSPPLDKAGNSVRAAKAINYIAQKLHANIFSSK